MKLLWLDLNSSYAHSSLALPALHAQIANNTDIEWCTNEEIDFGAYTWGRGTLMTFNARNQGTIGSAGDPNYLVFEWRWID